MFDLCRLRTQEKNFISLYTKHLRKEDCSTLQQVGVAKINVVTLRQK